MPHSGPQLLQGHLVWCVLSEVKEQNDNSRSALLSFINYIIMYNIYICWIDSRNYIIAFQSTYKCIIMSFYISAGFLCGSCPSGSWVSLDILSCSETCEVGIVLFFIWCKLVIHINSSPQLHSCTCLAWSAVTSNAVGDSSLFVNVYSYRCSCDWCVFACPDTGHWSPSRVESFHILCRSTYVHVRVCTCLPTCICMPVHLCCSPSVSNSLIQYT